jgi:hypothetical protein
MYKSLNFQKTNEKKEFKEDNTTFFKNRSYSCATPNIEEISYCISMVPTLK